MLRHPEAIATIERHAPAAFAAAERLSPVIASDPALHRLVRLHRLLERSPGDYGLARLGFFELNQLYQSARNDYLTLHRRIAPRIDTLPADQQQALREIHRAVLVIDAGADNDVHAVIIDLLPIVLRVALRLSGIH